MSVTLETATTEQLGEWVDCHWETWADWAWASFRVAFGMATPEGATIRRRTKADDDVFEAWIKAEGEDLFFAGTNPKTLTFGGVR